VFGIMVRSPESKPARFWKALFLTAQIVVLLGCVYDTVGALCYNYYSSHGIAWSSGHITVRIIGFGERFLKPMLWSFIASEFVLLVVSVFFMWSTLRKTAIRAWGMGLLALVYVAVFVKWR
jgi:hypothetical protein